MSDVVELAAESTAARAVRQMMSLRDEATKNKFIGIYGALSQTKLADALVSPTIKSPQSYTVNFDEFLSSGNATLPYAAPPLSYQVNTLPKTPADDLLYSGHPIYSGGVLWESSQLVDISYNQKLASLGMSHLNWTADVLMPLRSINQHALESRTQFSKLLCSTSAASWTIRLMQSSNHCNVWVSNHVGLGAEEKDRSTACDYVLCICLIPVRVLSCIITTPLLLMVFIFTALVGSLMDLISCHSCRIDTPAKLEAITRVMKTNPNLDENTLSDRTHSDLQHLASSLNGRYGTALRFEAVVTAEFVDGQYLNKYIPAHVLMKHSLAIFSTHAV